MAITNQSDLNKEMYVGHMEVWKKNLEKPAKEQWREYATIKNSTKMEETYETLGNLDPAQETAPSGQINYGTIKDAYETTVKNKKYTNGFSVDIETYDDDQYAVVDETKVNELYRTMITLREKNVAAQWNGVFTTTGSDGVAQAASNHPLKNSALVNDNLMTSGPITPDSVINGAMKFNAIKNQAGDVFDTDATAILAHKDKMALVQAVLSSNLKAMELSNTKNTVPNLKAIFSKYLDANPWHLLDEAIASVIMQIRSGLKTNSYFDDKDTLTWYFNAWERYRAAIIHPGYGFISNPGI
ncbi:MAG: Mu-like prophage major head subunit gpT family protein [Caulobacteraceae bacterium]